MKKSYSTTNLHNLIELKIEDIKQLEQPNGEPFWTREIAIKMEGGVHYISLFATNPDALTLSVPHKKELAK
jgi:hypothetical protein